MVSLGNDYSECKFLLVEPIAKTPYPPLGLMKIGSMLKDKYRGCEVLTQVGNGIPNRLASPQKVFITSLFTWDWKHVVGSVNFYRRTFPNSQIMVGGIAASLLSDEMHSLTGIEPHRGLYAEAEFYPPDYTLKFGRQNGASITFTTRGCTKNCRFCSVGDLEPSFLVKENWEKDIVEESPLIVFWDNNFLASPNFGKDSEKIVRLNKRVDFNQGLDARLLDEDNAKQLFRINLAPIRFAFDHTSYEEDVLRAVRLARKYSHKEIVVYVLYNFQDTPEDLFYRINLLNKEGILSFPMEYRPPTANVNKLPGRHWNMFLLRAFKLSLLYYYRKGTITRSRQSFESIYGENDKQFVSKLYDIYRYDKSIKKARKNEVAIRGGGE